MNSIKASGRRLPGLLYLVLALAGFYTGYALDFFGSGDSAALWFRGLSEKRGLYASGILSLFIMNLSWILLAHSLFHRFKGRSPLLSGLLLLSVTSGSVLVFFTILLRSFPLYLFHLMPRIPEGELSLWMSGTYGVFMAGGVAGRTAYIFYSLWLFPLALCLRQQRSLAGPAGILITLSLFTAGAGYLEDFLWFHLFPLQKNIDITGYTFYGEVIALMWLLVKGLDGEVCPDGP